MIFGGVFYSHHTLADEQQKALIAEQNKEADQLFVDKLALKTSKRERVTDVDLVTLTRSNRIGKVTKVTLSDNALKQAKPGFYEVQLTIHLPAPSEITTTKTAEVTVTDDVAPVITVPKDLSETVGTDFPFDRVKVVDAVDGTIVKDKITITGFDKNKAGRQEVTVKAQDQAGNEAAKKLSITMTPTAPTTAEKIAAEKANSEAAAESTGIAESRSEQAQQEANATSAAADDDTDAATLTSTSAAEEPTSGSQGAAVADQAGQAEGLQEQAAPVRAAAARATGISAIQTATLSFNGSTIPFIQYNGADAAPGFGAGTWMGSGSTTDGAPTHFIGHNPGDFSGVMNLGVGSTITVVDDSGNARTYTVYEVLDVTDDGYNNNDPSDDVLPRMLYAGGERISLQTCITDTVNRCILAQ